MMRILPGVVRTPEHADLPIFVKRDGFQSVAWMGPHPRLPADIENHQSGL
jgi:hypothetical protein